MVFFMFVSSAKLNVSVIVSLSGSFKNIWKSYIWTADKDVNESDPRSNVHYLGSSENKAWKKFMRILKLIRKTFLS